MAAPASFEPTAGSALDAALPRLRCPVCRDRLGRDGRDGRAGRDGRTVRCAAGHSFDLARQGYLNLAVGRRAGTADTPAMVASRAAFLGRGHYRPVAAAIIDAVAAATVDADREAAFVLDLAGGTGYHLAAVLDATGGHGACTDLSSAALQRAARAHPRMAAIGADAWRRLPFGDGVADAVLSVFGPRDAVEIERVLSPGGVLVTVSPQADHLGEIVGPLGLIGVDPHKRARTAAAFENLIEARERAVRYRLELTRDDAYAAAAMGPSAWHVTEDVLRARAAALAETTDVTVAVDVRTYRRRPG